MQGIPRGLAVLSLIYAGIDAALGRGLSRLSGLMPMLPEVGAAA
jgi:hypothetical protein